MLTFKRKSTMTFDILQQLLLFYILANCIVYFFSDYSIFVPPRSTYVDFPGILKLKTSQDKTISAFYMPNPQSKYVILFSHGNAEDLGGVMPILKELHNLGFGVIGYDYDGYGTSDGRASEAATYADIEAVYKYLTTEQKIPAQDIIVFGRSVGSGPSIDLATKHKIGGLILEGAFVSAYRVITRIPIFLFDKYKNLAKLQNIHVPILFIHGTKDRVIPFWHGKKLYESYQGPKEHYWIADTGHNDIDYQHEGYKEAILSFVKQLDQTVPSH